MLTSICSYGMHYRYQTEIENVSSIPLTISYDPNDQHGVDGIFCQEKEIPWSDWNDKDFLDPYDGKGPFQNTIQPGKSEHCLYAMNTARRKANVDSSLTFSISVPTVGGNYANTGNIIIHRDPGGSTRKRADKNGFSAYLDVIDNENTYGLKIDNKESARCDYSWFAICGGKGNARMGHVTLSLSDNVQGELNFCVEKPIPCQTSSCNYDVDFYSDDTNNLFDSVDQLVAKPENLSERKNNIQMLSASQKIGTIKISKDERNGCLNGKDFFYAFTGTRNNEFSVQIIDNQNGKANDVDLSYDKENSKIRLEKEDGVANNFTLAYGSKANTSKRSYVNCQHGFCQPAAITLETNY